VIASKSVNLIASVVLYFVAVGNVVERHGVEGLGIQPGALAALSEEAGARKQDHDGMGSASGARSQRPSITAGSARVRP
jgi:hypothetical protein